MARTEERLSKEEQLREIEEPEDEMDRLTEQMATTTISQVRLINNTTIIGHRNNKN